MPPTGTTSFDLRDEKTFEALFREHYGPLVQFATKYVGKDETAEELVQELFSTLWIKAEALEIRTSLKSYLFGAVRNACLNHLKHEKVKQAYTLHVQHGPTHAPELDFLELEELKEKIEQAMDQLPEKCRAIFEMSRYEGKKYQEIADALQLSVKTVENQMGKALRILREALKDYLPLLVWLLADGGIW
ncbi:RNA polymerase sigma-70 factor, ECF subfamily [Catalinimonas alkaloidigena]|uniref:RNA polymerase sigma-70 factor, ECF subfamily n=1 Tax=Catalinimonas alkaloidigena TaxID=1075417 RepID=A0A1G9GKM2_9BACT|nr:RNA polymerase sigma-70 factor [Catalinimonas alkaloidigena]SDL01186.1 RNA polymerase sigma-70 factor, ECF subfamily [Catalinimonas alkaloidigena]